MNPDLPMLRIGLPMVVATGVIQVVAQLILAQVWAIVYRFHWAGPSPGRCAGIGRLHADVRLVDGASGGRRAAHLPSQD